MNIGSANVPDEFQIRSPVEFGNLLLLLSRVMDVGALKQYEVAGSNHPSVDVRQLSPDGPWPDIVEADFVAADGRRYHLFVDTFHGAGGQWRVVD